MHVMVKFFARLREEFGVRERPVEAAPGATVQDVWATATGRDSLPRGVFCAINHEHAKPQDAVSDGDEVAFFPRITGGGL